MLTFFRQCFHSAAFGRVRMLLAGLVLFLCLAGAVFALHSHLEDVYRAVTIRQAVKAGEQLTTLLDGYESDFRIFCAAVSAAEETSPDTLPRFLHAFYASNRQLGGSAVLSCQLQVGEEVYTQGAVSADSLPDASSGTVLTIADKGSTLLFTRQLADTNILAACHISTQALEESMQHQAGSGALALLDNTGRTLLSTAKPALAALPPKGFTQDGRTMTYAQELYGMTLVFASPVPSVWRKVLLWDVVPFLALSGLMVFLLSKVVKSRQSKALRRAYAIMRDTQSELKTALAAAEHAAATDSLTDMLNFTAFRKQLETRIACVKGGQKGMLVMLDGDRFKQVNDHFGHNAGDEMIQLIGRTICQNIRAGDIASRLHGDEFAIWMNGVEDFCQAQALVKRINRSLSQNTTGYGAVTISAGAAAATADDTYYTLSQRADAALYQAKETHSGCFACCPMAE